MERRVAHHIVEIVLVAGIILFVVLNSTVYFGRFDLTSTKAFTISEVSRNLFRELENQVAITYYLSDGLKRRVPEAQEIEDLVREYAAFSRGTITVQIVDPKDAELEQAVQNLGVVPQQFQVVEEGEQSFSSVYTGIVIEYLDRYQTLPVVLDPSSIEYELTSTIREIVRNEPRSIGILLGDDTLSLQDRYRLTAERLSRSFEVREIEAGEPIPPDLSALFVLGHRDIDEYELYAIDQYLMAGNSVFFGADGVFVDIAPSLSAKSAQQSPLLDLLRSYGFTVESALVMDQRYKRIPITRRMGNATVQSYEPYPQWVSVTSAGADPDHPVTSRFAGVDLLWAAPITVADDVSNDASSYTRLLWTSRDAWLMRDPYVVNPLNRNAFERDAETTRGEYTLAVAFSGRLASYFVGRDLPESDGRPALEDPAETETSAARMIIVGDSQFAGDYLRASDSGYNLTFLQNVAEWLVNDEDLLTIRTRAQRPMALDRIQDPDQRARVGNAARIINVYLVPLAVAFAGIWRLSRRRRRSQSRGTA
jgi:gliding-associated putative ABC transporter substrate-binding component GldG